MVAVNFVKQTKVSDFGPSERFFIILQTLSNNLKCCLEFSNRIMSTIDKIMPVSTALIIIQGYRNTIINFCNYLRGVLAADEFFELVVEE